MLNTSSPKAQKARPRSRKSIAHVPASVTRIETENTGNEIVANDHLSGKLAGRKPRSKSLGPGGLDALKESTGNRQKSELHLSVKSILKPTIPLSPPKPIPPRTSVRNASPTKSKRATSPTKVLQRTASDDQSPLTGFNQSGLENVPNPFLDHVIRGTEASPMVHPEFGTEKEQQQQDIKERERRDIIERRDARRKSLANRRVSFAPEATLHTWDVVELPEDATTSSEATNSTRRGSIASNQMVSPLPRPQEHSNGSTITEPPSTPPEQIEEVQVTASPAHQRDIHQSKRRRNPSIAPMKSNNSEDCCFSSPGSSIESDDTVNQTLTTVDEHVDSSDDSDNDLIEEEGTVAELVDDDLTSRSIVSIRSNGSSSTSSSSRLEAALRQAAQQAGTQGIEYDENGELTMEMADEDITASFKPWVNQVPHKARSIGGFNSLQDQENMNPFSPAFKANLKAKNATSEDQEETMDFTHAAGNILYQAPGNEDSHDRGNSKPKPLNDSTTSMGSSSKQSPAENPLYIDQTMDLTTAFGGIQHKSYGLIEDETELVDENEDLTMEFTSVLGGVIDQSHLNPSIRDNSTKNHCLPGQHVYEGHQRIRESQAGDEEDMDMTAAIDGVLETITERTEPDEDQTFTMEITTAIGSILPKGLTTNDRSMAKTLMECETDAGQLADTPFQDKRVKSPLINEKPRLEPILEPLLDHLPSATLRIQSPELGSTKNRWSTRSAIDNTVSTTPQSSPHRLTPLKKPFTPSKQLTPNLPRPTAPGKTPPSKNVTLRTSSPKKLFKAEIRRSTETPRRSTPVLDLGFDARSGAALPNVVLTPQRRQTSGLGIDKEGLGSPKLAQVLDRRGSIGNDAKAFTPQSGSSSFRVRFEDPRAMEQEIDRECAAIQRHESGRGILQMEADMHDAEEEKDATANLRDMIESLTPKKNKLKGRKSLHIGAAKGLLGKRPAELDEDDEDENTPKRLKGRESSPVKNIKLLAPPSKAETTGRSIKAPRLSLGNASGNVQCSTPKKINSPTKAAIFTTPKDQARFRDAEVVLSATKLPPSFDLKLAGSPQDMIEPTEEDDRIHLQEFLNLTSIRFMELTTTKRRHTVVPNNISEDSVRINALDTQGGSFGLAGRDLEKCVVAGACTVPMLELYQHSCRELKKYISEGRSIVREIEADTFEENPPLFREYISAPPDVKSIMDNQFKNVKTHARLLSKAMWYEWRSKLLDGLKDGLLKIGEGLDEDTENLARQERLFEPVLPQLIEKHTLLQAESELLQAQADEIANCDQEQLKKARQQIATTHEELESKKQMLADLQRQLRDQEDCIQRAINRKQECVEDIKEAEKVREECRGWSGAEVAILKANVDALEHSSGWTIASASSPSLTLSYRLALHLFLTPSSFLPTNSPASISISSALALNQQNPPIGIIHVADPHLHHDAPLCTEKRFFLQIMRARLQALNQTQTPIKDVLDFVTQAWDYTCNVAEEIRKLNLTCLTEPVIVADEVLVVNTMVLFQECKAKVEVGYKIVVGGTILEWEVETEVTARVVYGEVLAGWGWDRERIEGVLRRKINPNTKAEGKRKEKGEKAGYGWSVAVRELKDRIKGTAKPKGR